MSSRKYSREYAQSLDEQASLCHYRERFHIPQKSDGSDTIYLCGNSLGLQPKNLRASFDEYLSDWDRLGVEGHFHARMPWLSYHEIVAESLARLVGASPTEVVAMNTLTVNLHLLMVSFYRPTAGRYKILIEKSAFPSDRYAVRSQTEFHGFDPAEAGVLVGGNEPVSTEEIIAEIVKQGDSLALVMLGGVNYLTGQAFDMARITEAAHRVGAVAGFDLAHAVGNIPMQLHEWDVDFAVWCSYKYLNAGPGGIAGAYVHKKHHDTGLPRFAGWWGHEKSTRFQMPMDFKPIPTAESWQLSNPAIAPLVALRASLDHFDEAGIGNLRQRSVKLTAFMEELLLQANVPGLQIITPTDSEQRGAQLSIRVPDGRRVFEAITREGVIADWREPDVIRVAAVPLYNSFCDVFDFVDLLKKGSHAT